MKIEGFELRRVAMPLVSPFRTSFGTQTARDILLVKAVNKIQSTAIRKKEAEAVPAGPTQEELLMQIRDELRAQKA